jgi:HEAT repeat protein
VEALCAALEAEMKGGYLTVEAISEALTAIGDRRAIPALMRVVEHGNCHARTAAATALGAFGDRRALNTLRHALLTHKCCGQDVVTNSIHRIETLSGT